jgi:hypothetical protein
MAEQAHIPYTVLSQQQTEELTPYGRFVDVVRVNFQTPNGHIGTVRIPLAQFTPGYVDNVIQAQVQQFEAVHQLGAAPYVAPEPEMGAGA